MNELSKPADVKTPEETWYEELFNFRPDPKGFVGYQYHDHRKVDISRRDFKKCSIVRLNELRLKYKGDTRLDDLRKRFEGLPDGLYIKRSSQLIPGADTCFWFEDDGDDILTRDLKNLTSKTGLLLQELTTGFAPVPQKEAAQPQARPTAQSNGRPVSEVPASPQPAAAGNGASAELSPRDREIHGELAKQNPSIFRTLTNVGILTEHKRRLKKLFGDKTDEAYRVALNRIRRAYRYPSSEEIQRSNQPPVKHRSNSQT